MTLEGQTIRFAPGQLIFKEGEKGDVIFHIERGVVEIFVGEGNGIVVLTEMNAGEIVGVMAAVTGEPRLASARAKTEVISKKIPSQSITEQVKSLPNWVKAAFKDYRGRLDHVNKTVQDQAREIKKLRKKLQPDADKLAAEKKTETPKV